MTLGTCLIRSKTLPNESKLGISIVSLIDALGSGLSLANVSAIKFNFSFAMSVETSRNKPGRL